jgi:plasmid stabilization system protein ParE
MAREVVWGIRAWQDLLDAAENIGQGSEDNATAFVSNVTRAVETLSQSPEWGLVVGYDEVEGTTFRRLLVANSYRVTYGVADTTVDILAFGHTARRPERDD